MIFVVGFTLPDCRSGASVVGNWLVAAWISLTGFSGTMCMDFSERGPID